MSMRGVNMVLVQSFSLPVTALIVVFVTQCARNCRLHDAHKSGFSIDYCGAFYFFIRYLQKKQEHYQNDIKPVFIKWANLNIQPLDHHYSYTFDTLLISIIDSIHAIDKDGLAASHLQGYNEYDLLLWITRVVNQYNTNVQEFIRDITSRIQSEVAAFGPYHISI